ncbi:MAG: DUF2764 domain-containing protein [Spirochaetaceae bacterium]|nr:DUF2764 domain-containing protein [Spirochaetaceae bacterium]
MYYFLIAQLPYLSYGQTPPVSSPAFKELCREHLSKEHFSLLRYCVCGIPQWTGDFEKSNSAFIDGWRKRERSLTLALARIRADRLKAIGVQTNFPLEHWDMDAENQAKSAASMDNPLEAELFLDKGRWEAVESLQKTTYFGVNAVYAYMLKLLLIERRAAFKTEEGFTEYKALYASIMENAPGVGARGDS